MLTQVLVADGFASNSELLSIRTRQFSLPSKASDHAAILEVMNCKCLFFADSSLCITCRWQQLEEAWGHEGTCLCKVQGLQEGAASQQQQQQHLSGMNLACKCSTAGQQCFFVAA